jgi:hypothetical protein
MDIRAAVGEIYSREFVGIKMESLFLFEHIPQKKLQKAIKSYAPGLGSNPAETIICLYDDTVFGGAKEGFILTTERLYSKDTLESPRVVGIWDIVSLVPNHGSLTTIITVAATFANYIITLTQAGNTQGRIALYNLIDKTILVLRGGQAYPQSYPPPPNARPY